MSFHVSIQEWTQIYLTGDGFDSSWKPKKMNRHVVVLRVTGFVGCHLESYIQL